MSEIEPEVVTVLEAVPEFAARYLALVEEADGDPGAAAALTELADYVAEVLASLERQRAVLVRCSLAIDTVVATGPDAEELVAWAFLDSLSPDHLRVLVPWLGPRTKALVRELDPGPA